LSELKSIRFRATTIDPNFVVATFSRRAQSNPRLKIYSDCYQARICSCPRGVVVSVWSQCCEIRAGERREKHCDKFWVSEATASCHRWNRSRWQQHWRCRGSHPVSTMHVVCWKSRTPISFKSASFWKSVGNSFNDIPHTYATCL
jgi:hypothetical protein